MVEFHMVHFRGVRKVLCISTSAHDHPKSTWKLLVPGTGTHFFATLDLECALLTLDAMKDTHYHYTILAPKHARQFAELSSIHILP